MIGKEAKNRIRFEFCGLFDRQGFSHPDEWDAASASPAHWRRERDGLRQVGECPRGWLAPYAIRAVVGETTLKGGMGQCRWVPLTSIEVERFSTLAHKGKWLTSSPS